MATMGPAAVSFLVASLLAVTTSAPADTGGAITAVDDFAAARARYDAGDAPGAVRLLEEILKARPGDAQATLFLGAALVSVAEDDARAGRPATVVEANARRGRALLEKAETLLAPTPTQAWVDHAIGYGYLLGGDSVTARDRFSRAIAKNPNAGRDYLLRARLDLQLGGEGSEDRAEKDLARAVRLLPTDLVARAEYADLVARRGRGLDAIATLREYLELIKDQPPDARRLSALHQISEHALRLFDLPTSRRALEQALPLAPENPDLRLRLAEVLYRLGDLDAASRELDWLMAHSASLAPKVVRETHYFLGLVAKHRGEFALARTHFEATVKAAPWHAAALQNLGAVLLRAGDKEGGRAMMTRFRDAAATATRVDQLRMRLRQGTGYDRDTYFALADELLKSGDRAEAGEIVALMRERLPHDPALAALEKRLTQ